MLNTPLNLGDVSEDGDDQQEKNRVESEKDAYAK